VTYGQERPLENIYRLPLPIDPRNPERGLWGMIDWSKWEAHIIVNGKLRITNHRPRVFSETWFDVIDTPTLALLKTLTVQERIKV